MYTTVRLLNLLTLGVAHDDYCISKEQLFKLLMVLHFTDVYNMYNLSASASVWCPTGPTSRASPTGPAMAPTQAPRPGISSRAFLGAVAPWRPEVEGDR